MTSTLQTIARHAAQKALEAWKPDRFASAADEDDLIADAVALAVLQRVEVEMSALMQPQSGDGLYLDGATCWNRLLCFVRDPALIALPVTPEPLEVIKEKDFSAALIHQTIPDMAGTAPRPSWREWLCFIFTDNSRRTQALPDAELRMLICRNVDTTERATELLAAMKAIVGFDQGYGPMHHGTKENYEWYGRAPRVWEAARQAIANAESLPIGRVSVPVSEAKEETEIHDAGAGLIHANDTGHGDTLPRLTNRQVWVDLDGVLADFDSHYHREFGVRLDRNGEEPSDLWQNIRTRGDWFDSLPLMPGAMALWDALKPYSPKILSGLSVEKYANGEAQKRRWVAQHFGADVEVVICRSKRKCEHGKPGDILIDDWHKYSHLWNQMGGVFVMHRENAETLAIVHALMIGSDTPLLSEASGDSAQERSEREKNLRISSLTPLERSAMNDITVCPVRTYDKNDLGAQGAAEGATDTPVVAPREVREGE